MTRAALPLILFCSYAVRVVLAASGGAYFWPDEMRYHDAQHAVQAALAGEWARVLQELLGHPDHVLFRAVALPAALLEHLFGRSPVLAGGYFAIFSTLVILLVWAICRRAGGSIGEANWAALFAATANTLFFYSRHYLPYDASLALMLTALWLALGPPSLRRSLAVGATVSAGFLVYNGHWLPGAAVLITYTLLPGGGLRGTASRALAAGIGLLAPIIGWVAVGEALGYPLVSGSRSFAGTVVQGDFGLGYLVIAGFLWNAERLVLLLWLVFLGYAGVRAVRHRQSLRRLRWWVVMLGLLLAGLILLSDVTHQFVVYGRLVRPLVPFLALGAAAGVVAWRDRLKVGARGGAQTAVAAALILLAAGNFATPLRQQFLPDFRERITDYLRGPSAVPGSVYRLAAVQEFWEGLPVVDLRPHEVVLREPHPLQFRPYQYESHTAQERAELRARDYAMRLVRLQSTSPLPLAWNGYPGPVRLTVRFPAGPIGQAQPLVTSGEVGRADLFYVRMLGGGQAVFGLDHWGIGGFESPPVSIDPDQTYTVTLSFGPLLPPEEDPWYVQRPELAHLRTRALILLGDELLYSGPGRFHPATPATLMFGVNLVGGSVVSSNFRGDIVSVDPAPLAEVGAYLPGLVGQSLAQARGPEWDDHLGPIRLRFELPAPLQDQPQPLLAFGEPGEGALLLVIRRSDGLQFGFDRSGHDLVLSQRIAADPDALHEVEIFAPGLMPPEGAAVYRQNPALEPARELLYLRLNGRPAFQLPGLAAGSQGPVVVGANTTGSAAAAGYFSGRFAGSSVVDADAFGPRDLSAVMLPVIPDPRWDGYTGPLRLRVVFPRNQAGRSEPLVVSGTPGAADFVYVQYLEDGRIRLGYDHWGAGGPLSDPVTIEPGAAQDLVLSYGGLMPPLGHGVYRREPQLQPLRGHLYLALNGETIFNQAEPSHGSPADTISIGLNVIGGSSCATDFRGRIGPVERVAPAEVMARSRSSGDLARPGAEDYPGPVRLVLRLPPLAERQTETGEPLVTTGVEGAGNFVLLQHAADGTTRIGYDHWGAPLQWSEPIELRAGEDHEFIISHGGLLPPGNAPVYSEVPGMRALRERVVVRWNGRPLLDIAAPAHVSPPGTILYGFNPIGGSTTARALRARVVTVELADPALVRPVNSP